MDWLLSARRGNLDLLLDAVNPRLGEPAYYDVFARAGGEVAGRGRLEVSTFHFSDDIRFTQEEDGATSRVNNQYLWAKWTTEADGLIQQTVFSTGKVDRRHTGYADDGDRLGGSVLDVVHLRTNTITHDSEWGRGPQLRILAVGTLRQQRMEYETDIDAVRGSVALALGQPEIIDREFARTWSGISSALHVSARYQPSTIFTIEGGIRLDHQNFRSVHAGERRRDQQPSPRLSVLLSAAPTIDLRASVGRFHQPHALNEMRPADGEYTLPSPQRADHWIAGTECGRRRAPTSTSRSLTNACRT